MSSNLQVNDAVWIRRAEGTELEGVVAYLGEVSFDETSGSGDSWIGVRLTGKHVGMGKHDGTVQGRSYFSCPPKCGLFVKASSLRTRSLTRLEELKLKRELRNSGAAASSSTPAAASTPTQSRLPRTPARTAAAAPTTPQPPTATATPPPSSSTRLEEIRRRREALQSSRASTTPPPATSPKKPADKPADKDDETGKVVEALKQELQTVKAALEASQRQLKQQQQETKSDQIDASAEAARLQTELETQRAAFHKKWEDAQAEHKETLLKLTAVQTELKAHLEQQEAQNQDQTNHYKERAKLQAEVASLNRRVEQLDLEKQDLDNTVEELALDKEQLQEEKEVLEDRLEEFRLDAETAQMEVEELRMELERASEMGGMTNIPAMETDIEGGDEQAQQQQDAVRALNIQNARLREALIRLREQSAIEKMEVTRQLRAAEKDAQEKTDLETQLQELKAAKMVTDEQISDLKDMVEQGSAYEVMVEDLSDRVLSLEEELVAQQALIREMEEAADITAEMEEVQADELKALNRDLEDRESTIRNLEEAIKMQRKRENDFQRTVANYRSSLEKLKQEKNALLELQQGGEGEKSDLVSASQKALARAAQLVQDAAEMRKREAQAAIDRIDSQIRMHLSQRLESMLPPSVAAPEVASIKGELLLSKVVGKASLSLDGIAASFTKTVKLRAWDWRGEGKQEDSESSATLSKFSLSDEEQQMAATMIHQSEVAHVAIDVSGDLLWLLSAGQWPDVLTPEASAELGAIMGHSMSELDAVLGNVLNTLKEEGVLSPHQSNIGAFRQTVLATMRTLRSQIEQDGESLVPTDWKPPALRLFRDASRAKFSSLGCHAAVASVLNHSSEAQQPLSPSSSTSVTTGKGPSKAKLQAVTSAFRPLLRKLDQAATEATKSCLRLAQLDVQDESIVSEIRPVANTWRVAADELLATVFKMLMSPDGITKEGIKFCEQQADAVVKGVSQFAASLRSANLHVVEDGKFHPFSPEVADVWEGVTLLARAVRAKDGDKDDVNYLIRTRTIEHALEDAVDKEPKLALANAKVASLEKSLATRSKEIALQNARLAELEKVLAKTSAHASPRIISTDMASSEEVNTLKQENRVLSEAMDVMHRQIEEYESEIRFLKDAKSPQGKRGMRTPRRVISDIGDRKGSSEDLQALSTSVNSIVFEAALFRPALHAVRRDAARWKSKATVSKLLELPPLHIGRFSRTSGGSSGEEKVSEEDTDVFQRLSSALSDYRVEAASIDVVDLTNPASTPRAQFHSSMMKKAMASDRLDQATAAARLFLEGGLKDTPVTGAKSSLWGKVKIGKSQSPTILRADTSPEDLYRLQSHFVQQ